MNPARAVACALIVAMLSGCGGGEPEATTASSPAGAAAGFGDVAFATYEVDGMRVVFNSDTKASKTWANMSGEAVSGTYTKNGNEIEIQWDPAADNHGSLSEKFRQTGPCALARYVRVDKEGGVHDADPKIFQRSKPLCDTVRLSQ